MCHCSSVYLDFVCSVCTRGRAEQLYLEPTHVEEELKKREERKDEVASVTTARTLIQ